MLQSIRSVLAIPAAYNLWWKVVGGPDLAKVMVREYLHPAVGARILESDNARYDSANAGLTNK
jgi:hypothetical protein